jgi:hypothetical protein
MNYLFIILLGGRPKDSTIEAHNVFFGVGPSIEALFPVIEKFWPSAPKIHIDAYMKVEYVDHQWIRIMKKEETASNADGGQSDQKLFFVNLGGYEKGLFEEKHKKILLIAKDKDDAKYKAMSDPFFSQGLSEGKAKPHVDDRRMLEEFEEETPIDIEAEVKKQGFVIRLEPISKAEQVHLKSDYPETVVTGYWPIL